MPRGKPIAALTFPGGVVKNLPYHLVPIGAFFDASNVITRDGVLEVRPGYVNRIAAGGVAQHVNGAIRYIKEDGVTYETVIATRFGMFRLDETGTPAWSDLTPATDPLTAGEYQHTRFAVFPQNDRHRLILVNDTDLPKVWDGIASTYSLLGGNPPIGRDITVAANRVIIANTYTGGRRNPYRLQVSNVNDATTWDASLIVDLADEPSEIIAIEALNRTSFAVYKRDSQWIAVAQAGAFPFRVEMVDEKPGPFGPGCVVKRSGAHTYIGHDGNVYRFNGIQAERIGDAIQRDVVDGWSYGSMYRTNGVYFSDRHQMWWFYPKLDDTHPRRVLVRDVCTNAFWKGLMSHDITACAVGDIVNFEGSDIHTLLIGSADGSIYRLGNARNDAGTAITYSWEFALPIIQGSGRRTVIDAIDTYFRQTDNSQTVNVSAGRSDTLAGTLRYDAATAVDPNTPTARGTEPERVTPMSSSATQTKGRFTGVRHSGTISNERLEWRGCVVYAYDEGTV